MFYADLHIHSRFSQGTSKYLTFEILDFWAQKKGLHLLGSGDCTHAAWLDELKNSLVYNSNTGFYTSKEKKSTLSYILQGEISCVYKEDGKTYRVHHIVFLPHFEAAEQLRMKLAKIGNINSDGRPILKLSSYQLLEIILEIPNAFLIPAHIWTPWYSLLGKKSGYESVLSCFRDLEPYIFALETGLSSDLKMNRSVQQLDSYAFISNSDAHSGQNLAREANIFTGDVNYQSLFQSMNIKMRDKSSARFIGTAEIFPKHGKYYTSGHRACDIALKENEEFETCPICNKKLTEGVAQRVYHLSKASNITKETNKTFEQKEFHFLPLLELISFVYGSSIKSKKIQKLYEQSLEEHTELEILLELDPSHLTRKLQNPQFQDIITKMRNNQLELKAGFDGIYGEIIV